MDYALCQQTGITYSATDFSILSPEHQKKLKAGLICKGCGDVAWFRSATNPLAKVKRAAHFNSHHYNSECQYRTSYLLIEDETDGELSTAGKIPLVTEYVINLDDKIGGVLADISYDQIPEAEFVVKPSGGAIGKGAGVKNETEANKSLRQILSYLKRFPEFRQSDKQVRLFSDAGRLKVDGKIKNLVVSFDEVNDSMDDNKYRLFWGVIVDAQDEALDGGLWLNASESRKGVSIKIFRDIKEKFTSSFHLKSLDDLQGAYVLVAGQVHYAPSTGKPTIYCAIVNFITVQKYKESQ
ncbi:TPA: hypothetical protein RUX67_001738 [Aeromonas dhakensis]|nr:hypothetical protein [Aeromonas dhakensis]